MFRLHPASVADGDQHQWPSVCSPYPPQVYPPETIQNQVAGYDQQNIDSKTTSYTGKFETKMSDVLSVYGGALYSKGSADIGGDGAQTETFGWTAGVPIGAPATTGIDNSLMTICTSAT